MGKYQIHPAREVIMSKRKSQILSGSYHPNFGMKIVEEEERLSQNTYLRMEEVKVNLDTITEILGSQDWDQCIVTDAEILTKIADEHEDNLILLEEIRRAIVEMSLHPRDVLRKQFSELQSKDNHVSRLLDKHPEVHVGIPVLSKPSPPKITLKIQDDDTLLDQFAKRIGNYTIRVGKKAPYSQPGDYAATLLCLWKKEKCEACKTDHYAQMIYANRHDTVPPIYGLDYHLRYVFSGQNTMRAREVGKAMHAAKMVEEIKIWNSITRKTVNGCKIQDPWKAPNIAEICERVGFQESLEELKKEIALEVKRKLGPFSVEDFTKNP